MNIYGRMSSKIKRHHTMQWVIKFLEPLAQIDAFASEQSIFK